MEKPAFYNIGFFGAPNLGDELICKCIVDRLREAYCESKVYVMTCSAEVSKTYTGLLEVECVEGFWPKPEYFLNLRKHVEAVRNSDLVVVGGGGLIADYYTWVQVPQFCVDALWAILMGRRYVFVGLGVRKIRRSWLSPLARFFCRHAAVVYCRDKESATLLKELTKRNDVREGPDLASLTLLEVSERNCEKDYGLVNVRERPPIDQSKFMEFCRVLLASTRELILLSAENSDADYYRKMVAKWGPAERSKTRIIKPASLSEAIRWIREAKFVTAERLHVNVLAAQARKLLLTINYEGKVEQFIGMLGGEPLICSLEDVGAEQAKRLLSAGAPQSFKTLCEMKEQAEKVFDETIRSGFSLGSYRYRERFAAGLYLMILLVLGLFWSAGVLVKRAVFGRGPLPWSR